MKGGELKVGWHGEEQGESLSQLSSSFVIRTRYFIKSEIFKGPDTQPFWQGEKNICGNFGHGTAGISKEP